jgi:hypothetical protein
MPYGYYVFWPIRLRIKSEINIVLFSLFEYD